MPNFQEAQTAFRADRARLNALGVHMLPSVRTYIPDDWRHNLALAADAQPLMFTEPNAAVPAILTTMIDGEVFRVLFSPTKAVEIYGEVKRGDWTMDTIAFPVVEETGEVSSYGDYSNNGRAGINANWPMRQNYIYQVIKEYGDREAARADLAKINWIAEIDRAAANVLARAANIIAFFGVAGMQNYGALNDPSLSAALTPSTKAAGGTAWVQSGQVKATANEIYNDLQALFIQLVAQSGGLIDQNDRLVIALAPGSAVALTQTNAFNVSVTDLLKKNFPNIRFVTAVQYGVISATNPNGVVAGNLVQMIAETIDGQKTGQTAYSEKYRAHPLVRLLSASQQKVSAGAWGTIVRMPFAIASMVGV